MNHEGMKFGRGPKELNGAVDLISQYRLSAHHTFFCKNPLPLAISDSRYLHNVVGDRQILKGEGMELDQLLQNRSYPSEDKISYLQPFDLQTRGHTVQMRKATPTDSEMAVHGMPSSYLKSNTQGSEKEQKHKRQKDTEKDKEHKKHKHSHKDRNKEKEKDRKDKSGNQSLGSEHLRKHADKDSRL